MPKAAAFLSCYFALCVAPASKQQIAKHVIWHFYFMLEKLIPKIKLGT